MGRFSASSKQGLGQADPRRFRGFWSSRPLTNLSESAKPALRVGAYIPKDVAISQAVDAQSGTQYEGPGDLVALGNTHNDAPLHMAHDMPVVLLTNGAPPGSWQDAPYVAPTHS
jgi:hypothetical protein